MNLTDEQVAAADAFRSGDHLVVQAGAGTGKTTTLAFLAASTGRRGRYLAYNRAIAQDAAARFPDTVTCKTAHSLAYSSIGYRYRNRLNAPRRPAWQTGSDLGITKNIRIDGRDVSTRTLSHLTLRAVSRFCQSADEILGRHHVPRQRGIEEAALHRELADHIVPFARKAWADLQHPDDGSVRFEHDHYLKIWALSQPVLKTDYLLLDEAQDTNPVVEQVFTSQREHTQLVMVGDSAQAIYGWRGAKDIMTGFDGTALTLSQSFRFGPRLAQEANRWLHLTDAPLRLTGTEAINTELGPLQDAAPDAVLCRTNVGAMKQIMELLAAEHRVALVGGGEQLRSLAFAARDLKEGRRSSHPELVLFPTWGELQDYAQYDPAGRDLQPFVDLVDTHGPDAILDAVARLDQEPRAQVVVSTAHKAKGREWATVRIADDFRPPKDTDEHDEQGNPVPGPIDDDEARLAYVAVTRTRRHLDMGGLAWINEHPDGKGALTPHSEQTPKTSIPV